MDTVGDHVTYSHHHADTTLRIAGSVQQYGNTTSIHDSISH